MIFVPLALTLLVAGILANDPNDAAAADHLALLADFLHRRTDLHGTLWTNALPHGRARVTL